MVWCRLHLKLPADCQGQDQILHLGRLGNAEATFFNGARITTGFGVREEPVFIVPAVLVKSGGENVIAAKIPGSTNGIGADEFDWSVLGSVAESLVAQGIKKSGVLEKRFSAAGPDAADFILSGIRAADFRVLKRKLTTAPSPAIYWQVATRGNRLCEIEKDPQRYLQEYALYKNGDRLNFMKNPATYLVPDFHDADPHKPGMGCDFSDFAAYIYPLCAACNQATGELNAWDGYPLVSAEPSETCEKR